jgi:hypothetical protein
LRDFISESDFSINILLLRVDEYKKEEKKKRYGPSDLIERVPRDIIDSVLLKEKEDYRIFIPQGLPVEFTAKDYLKATRSRSRYAVYGLRLLLFLDLAKCIGNKGRARLYSLT